jgi:uncharacterized protein YeaO (DUF488 family)
MPGGGPAFSLALGRAALRIVVSIKIKRVYEPPAGQDGLRVLVDRMWPRGLSKKNAAVELWMRDLAPSTELRKWFAHDTKKWEQFYKRYARELDENADAVARLKALGRARKVTLLYAAKDTAHNNAVALQRYLGLR